MSDQHDSTGNDKAIGYGRPPTAHRFKKGQSGNPKGRPAGARNLKSIVAAEQKQKVVVTEGGRSRTLTKQEAIIKTLHAKALRGDLKAIMMCVSLNERFLLGDDNGAPRAPQPDEDEMILNHFLQRQQQRPAEGEGDRHRCTGGGRGEAAGAVREGLPHPTPRHFLAFNRTSCSRAISWP